MTIIKDEVFIFILMLFLHIVDDYYLQGILANLKQKRWWNENAPQEKYKNDYIAALMCHSFSWSFMICLPLAIYKYNDYWATFVLINSIIHMIVDDLKANRFKINLLQDQFIHFIQICISFLGYLFTTLI